MRVKNRTGNVLLIGLLGATFFHWNASAAAILMIVVAIAAFLITREDWRPVPIISLLLVAYVAGYAVPVLFYREALMYQASSGGMPPATMDHMMRWALRGFTALVLAYALTVRAEGPLGATQGRKTYSKSYTSFALLVIAIMTLVAWAINVMSYGIGYVFIEGEIHTGVSGTLQQILSLLIQLKYAYILGYMLLRREGRATKAHQILFFAILAVAMVDMITLGSKGEIIKLVVAFLLAPTLDVGSEINWRLILGGVIAMAVALLSFGVITEYRAVMLSAESSGQSAASLGARYEVFESALVSTLDPNGDQRATDVQAGDVLSRFSGGAFSFGWLLYFTNNEPPYENVGASIMAPAAAIVPRFVWPEKPVYFNSGRYAHEYFGWAYGGISVSLIGSFYYAWGYAGILLGMALTGMALGRFARNIEKRGVDAINSVVCLAVAVMLLADVGSQFQSLVVDVTRLLLLMFAVRLSWAVLGSSRLRARRSMADRAFIR